MRMLLLLYMRRRRCRYTVLCFMLFCAVGAARAAFTIEPAVVTFNVAAGEKVTMVEVVNTGKNPAAVALTVFDRVMDLEGELDRTNSGPCKDFIVYPSEIILYPGKRANVQLTYKGKEKVAADKSYSLFSTEVLMPLEEEEAGDVNVSVPIVVSYYTIINLETGKPGRLTFVSSKAIGNNTVELIVENKSGGRVVARKLAIKTDTDVIRGFTGAKNSIMPGQKRRFTFNYFRPLTYKETQFIYEASD